MPKVFCMFFFLLYLEFFPSCPIFFPHDSVSSGGLCMSCYLYVINTEGTLHHGCTIGVYHYTDATGICLNLITSFNSMSPFHFCHLKSKLNITRHSKSQNVSNAMCQVSPECLLKQTARPHLRDC